MPLSITGRCRFDDRLGVVLYDIARRKVETVKEKRVELSTEFLLLDILHFPKHVDFLKNNLKK